MSDIKELTNQVVAFRDARDWKQFHGTKDAAIALNLEAAEVLEHVRWKNPEEMALYAKTHKEDFADELSDVLFWVLLMAHDLNIDLKEAFPKKLGKTATKYPIEKSKGSHLKYTELK